MNIGDRERRLRLVLGGVLLAAGLWIASGLVARDAAWGWRLLLFPLFYQGIRFFFDYRTGTCPLKAELGQCKLDGWMTILGDRIDDPARARRIRRISRRALVWSLLGAVLLTAGVIAL
jgi:hypothetical protein